jgi:hypothetical protein
MKDIQVDLSESSLIINQVLNYTVVACINRHDYNVGSEPSCWSLNCAFIPAVLWFQL